MQVTYFHYCSRMLNDVKSSRPTISVNIGPAADGIEYIYPQNKLIQMLYASAEWLRKC